eukprot:1161250-Pelagomonas_calceolata.AAC.4
MAWLADFAFASFWTEKPNRACVASQTKQQLEKRRRTEKQPRQKAGKQAGKAREGNQSRSAAREVCKQHKGESKAKPRAGLQEPLIKGKRWPYCKSGNKDSSLLPLAYENLSPTAMQRT